MQVVCAEFVQLLDPAAAYLANSVSALSPTDGIDAPAAANACFSCLYSYPKICGITRVVPDSHPWVIELCKTLIPITHMHCSCIFRLSKRDATSQGHGTPAVKSASVFRQQESCTLMR